MKISWPWGIVGFFVLFIGGIGTCIAIAVNHNEGLVSKDYYEQEIRYQQRIDAIKRTQEHGVIPLIAYDAATPAMTIRYAAPAAIQAATGTITLYRASDASLDRTVPFAPDTTGAQIIPGALAKGAWRVKLEWWKDGQPFYLEQAVKVP